MEYRFYYKKIKIEFKHRREGVDFPCPFMDLEESLDYHPKDDYYNPVRKTTLDLKDRIPSADKYVVATIILKVNEYGSHSLDKKIRLTSSEFEATFNEDYIKTILAEQTVDVDLSTFTKITDNLYLGDDLICTIKDGLPNWIKIMEVTGHIVLNDTLCIVSQYQSSVNLIAMDINTFEYKIVQE